MKDEKVVRVIEDILDLRRTILGSIIPEEAQKHFYTAKREALTGLSILIQHAIDKLDEQQSKNSQQEEQTNRAIKIE